jgi:hypothetical protein
MKALSLAVIMLLASTSEGLVTQRKINTLAQTLSQTAQSGTHSCRTAVERMKKAPIDHTKIVNTGNKYTDADFDVTKDVLWWPDYKYDSLSGLT